MGMTQAPPPASPPAGATVAGATVAGRITPAERDFMVRTAAQGLYEVEVSQLAAQRALDPNVRAYAQMMVSHHARANRELAALMKVKGVTAPRGLSADKATKLHRLASLPRSSGFDNGYVRVVGVEDHRASIAQFERARREATDRDLQAWIDRTLAVLREHLSAAQNLASTLAG